jgi:hypothetical protein
MTPAPLTAWSPADGVTLRSPFEHRFRDAGATIERRGAWRIPATVAGDAGRLTSVAFGDGSHVAKIEIRGAQRPAPDFDLEVLDVAPGRWIALTPWERRDAVMEDLGAGNRLVLDMTGAWGVLVVVGAERDRLLRRLGPIAAVPGAGPVAGVPGRVTRRGDALWVLVAVEFAQHVWDVTADVAAGLGGGPAGVDTIVTHTDDPLLRIS